MKQKTKLILEFCFTIFCCGIVFVLLAVLVLSDTADIAGAVNRSEASQPYTAPAPENTAVMFLWEEGGGEIVYLDFEQRSIIVTVLPADTDENAALVYGYREFEAVKANHLLIAGIIDRVGGIELDSTPESNEKMRYTGNQISALIGAYPDDWELKRAVIYKIFENISDLGFSNKDFMFIINNSNTTLSFPDCYGWQDEIRALAGDVTVID